MTDSGAEDGREWDNLRDREDEEMEFFTELALHETERWIQAVTRKKFEYPEDFRKSLSNGILLCELLNCLEPGSIKRINKLPGAIAGLDNLNVFLSACEKSFGLKKTQLFDPSDLEDLSQRAIADEKEGLLRQESDRRARNVAVCIYWLAKSVNGKYKGPTLDTSAFRAIVYTHGTKRDSIIADECFKNGLPTGKDKNGLETVGECNKENKHIRDSSYDSLDSVERESVSSFDDLDSSGNMPVRSDMREMRKYGSTSSLTRDLRFSTASQDSMYSDNKDDSMYQSSPDVSHAHTRSSSTDSAEGGLYSNHSRQSSGSTDYPRRRTSLSMTRKPSSSTPDPLQFVKLKGAAELAEQAKRQMQVAQETNIMRGKTNSANLSSDEPDWKSDLSSWKKQRRKSAHLPLTDNDDLDEKPEEDNRRPKTFKQIMAEKEKREGRKPFNVYPIEDEPMNIERTTRILTSPKSTPEKRTLVPKLPEVAPWAQNSSGEDNSHSDSENHSHQSNDNDSVFSSSDKSAPNKVLSDDDSWVKNKSSSHIQPSKARPLQTQKSQDSVLQKWQNSVNESHKSNENKNKVNIPNSNSKIKNITQAFEEKEKEVQNTPAKSRRSELANSKTKSLDLSGSKFTSYVSSPLSPTSPQALLPREQRFGHARSAADDICKTDQSSVEKVIKISQRQNNERGFGFVLEGGIEKKKPITVQRVNLGSAADVQEVMQGDELLEINGHDVTTLTLSQVQGMVDYAVKKGQIELKVKRLTDEEAYDSMEDEDNQSNQNNNNNNPESKMDTQSDSSSLSTDHTSLEEPPVKHVHQIPVKTDETGKPRLMDQLIGEQQWETNNNEKNAKGHSPVAVERMQIETMATTRSMPARQLSEIPKDLSAPSDVTLTEERPTLSLHKSPAARVTNQREPESSSLSHPPTREEPSYDRRHDNTSTASDDSSSSGFGPPAALLRWQLRKPKSEYNETTPSFQDQEKERAKRFSSTLPYKSAPFTFDETYAKDDSDVDKVTKNFTEMVSTSKPLETKPMAYQFNDSARLEDWQQKEEQKRRPEATVSFPRIELNIPKEENLTAQSASPVQKMAHIATQPEINVPQYDVPLSPQEKFERDQQRIRMQYEEDKRRAKEAEKHKQEQEKKSLDSDRFLQNMESQILQTKSEAANHNLFNIDPIRSSVTEPRFSSEPMTIKLSSNMPARPLVIDPRNQQEEFRDSKQPEYSFRVDLPKSESTPPLRTFNQPDETDALARERQKIEEEKRKLKEERQRWKEEQERQKREQEDKLRREREQLQRKQEEIEREKALLEAKRNQDNSFSSSYQSSLSSSLCSPPSSTTSSASHSPQSRSSLFASRAREPSGGKKVPPPTAPKPDTGVKEKARLTREDLLAMNRKATPLTKPDPSTETASSHSEPLSPTTREAPSKAELHSLNAVPKQKFRHSAPWMKEDDTSASSANTETLNDRPFVIGKRTDLIHNRDYSNPNDHWLVREAEKRRLAGRDNVESVTARAGPTKPSQSSLVSRFRGNVEPPARQNNRYSYPSYSEVQDTPSPRPLSTSGSNLRQYDRSPDQGITTQFSARTQPNSYSSNPSMSQTLPPSFSFNARNNSSATDTKPTRTLTEDREPVIAVSGKQECSHCGEELGFGAAMVIESLGLYYHVQCFRCCVCHAALGNGSEGADVRVRVDKLHCKNCYSNDEAGLKFSKV